METWICSTGIKIYVSDLFITKDMLYYLPFYGLFFNVVKHKKMNKSGKSDIRKGGKMFLFKYEVLIIIYLYENEKKTKKEKKKILQKQEKIFLVGF